MLEGVNLLYTYTETAGVWVVAGLWIAFTLIAAAAVYAWFLFSKRSTKAHFVVAILTTILCFGLMIGAFTTQTHEETFYKVTVDKGVSFVEFIYYYEVIDIEGEIYTIKEIPHDIPETIPPAPSETTSPTDSTWDTGADG